MSVQLDWEIDDVEAPLPDTSPGAGAGPGGWRRWWRFLAFVTLVVAVALGFLGFKIRQKQKEIENELRAVVELELTALIDGDRDLFLNRQDPDDRLWQLSQERAFDHHRQQVEQAAWDTTFDSEGHAGEVSVLRAQGDRGQALVQITHGEHTWRELWFYRWTQADGWRHARLDLDWLGEEQGLITLHLRFSYPERDAAIVTALAYEMEAWYDALAPLFGARPTNETLLTVQFAYRTPARLDELETYWDQFSSRTLLAPSPHQGHLSIDGGPNPELRGQMARYLVEALIWHQTGPRPDETLPAEVVALRHELRDWATDWLLAHPSFDPDTQNDTQGRPRPQNTPPTPLVDALVARKGVQIIPELVVGLQESETLDQALAAASLDPPDPTARFAFLLAAHSRALHDLDESLYQALADPQADRAWLQYHSDQLRWRRESANAGSPWLPPPPVQVWSVVFNGDIAWVESETTSREGNTYRQVHFFRRVGDGWSLTSPDPAYLGERRTMRTENLIFHYFDRDAQWFAETLPAELQTVFDRATADLGLSTDDLVFTVEIEMQPGFYGWEVDSPPTRLKLTSPSVAGWRVGRTDAWVFGHTYSLVRALTQLKSSDLATTRFHYPHFMVQEAIAQWELRRLFPERADLEHWLPIDANRVAALSLTDLWTEPAYGMSQRDWERIWAGHHTLIEYLAETYGPEIVPALLDNLSQTEDLDEWLRLSTGDGLEEIEPAWQAWVLAAYGD